MKRLAILGASGHGKVVADTALLCGWDEVVFFDDAYPDKTMNGHWRIKGDTKELIQNSPSFDGVVVAIGDNQTRLKKLALFEDKGVELVNIIHPSAIVSRYVSVGVGTVIFANVVVNVDTKIGKAVILNTACSVDHDCDLADGVHISPGAHIAGGVSIGSSSWIGIGASVRQCVYIADNVTVGAGATVVSDVICGSIMVGTPARPINKDKSC